MKFGFKKEYWVWLLMYMLANIVGAIIMINTGFMIGDVDGFRLIDINVLILALVVEVFFYYFILKTCFSFLFRIKIPKIFPIHSTEKSSSVFGWIILLLQLLYVVFNISNGVNVAGTRATSDSIWNFVWVFTPIDMMFLIYYGLNRDDKLFGPNLAVYIISNLLRGWSGIFIYIMFFEWCRAYRNNKLKSSKIAMILLISVMLYPILLSLKWLVRASSGDVLNITSVAEILVQNADSDYYFQMLESGMYQLIGRLQHTSVITEIINGRIFLQEEFGKGVILPFWSDGLPQLTYRKVLGIDSPFNLGVILTQYFYPENLSDARSWNISVGFSGWFYVAPHLIAFYIFYMLALCGLSVVFIKQLEPKPGAFDVVWLAWLSFLMQGWIMAFISFVYAIFLFGVLRLLSQQLARITFKPKSKDTEPEHAET